jgi:hypothetical protein
MAVVTPLTALLVLLASSVTNAQSGEKEINSLGRVEETAKI